MCAIWKYPSFSAMPAKYVYRLRACDSPANDFSRFCSVLVPLSDFVIIDKLNSPFSVFNTLNLLIQIWNSSLLGAFSEMIQAFYI
jgi:hypothetical protein